MSQCGTCMLGCKGKRSCDESALGVLICPKNPYLLSCRPLTSLASSSACAALRAWHGRYDGRVRGRAGRVLAADGGSPERGLYACGWVKRGPTGIIGALPLPLAPTCSYILFLIGCEPCVVRSLAGTKICCFFTAGPMCWRGSLSPRRPPVTEHLRGTATDCFIWSCHGPCCIGVYCVTGAAWVRQAPT